MRATAVPVFVVGSGTLFALGLFDLVRARESRYARALVAAGVLWSLSALALSSDPVLFSIGRASWWLVDLALVYLLLSYPSGRLLHRVDRVLFVAATSLVATLWLPTMLVVHHFPTPGVWSTCTSACQANAFDLGHANPALVRDLIVPLRELLTLALFAAVAVVLTRRMRTLGPLSRRMYSPIVVIAVFRVALLTTFFVLRRGTPESGLLPVVMWTYVLSLPALGLACLAGRLNRRLFVADALDRIARGLRTDTTAAHASAVLADALEDPSLHVLHSFADGSEAWVDESGKPVGLPQDGVQEVTEVVSGDWRVAVLHDPALSEDRALVQTAGSYAVSALENDRLSGKLRSSLEELRESRALGVAAEERERRKIERDLHDGAQQRLVALRVKLALAADQLEDRAPASAETIRALGADVDATIDELRSFVRGVYPSTLAQTGLRDALRVAARGAALPATVNADRLGRYPPEFEMAVYFSCSEALQNAAKHARGATAVAISAWADRELHFEVRDDGAGFDMEATPYGTGLTNLRDRLAALGGAMTIRSVAGRGTSIAGSIPLA